MPAAYPASPRKRSSSSGRPTGLPLALTRGIPTDSHRLTGRLPWASLRARSGRSAVWLAHLTGGQGVGGSNPLAPIFQPFDFPEGILIKAVKLDGGERLNNHLVPWLGMNDFHAPSVLSVDESDFEGIGSEKTQLSSDADIWAMGAAQKQAGAHSVTGFDAIYIYFGASSSWLAICNLLDA